MGLPLTYSPKALQNQSDDETVICRLDTFSSQVRQIRRRFVPLLAKILAFINQKTQTPHFRGLAILFICREQPVLLRLRPVDAVEFGKPPKPLFAQQFAPTFFAVCN